MFQNPRRVRLKRHAVLRNPRRVRLKRHVVLRNPHDVRLKRHVVLRNPHDVRLKNPRHAAPKMPHAVRQRSSPAVGQNPISAASLRIVPHQPDLPKPQRVDPPALALRPRPGVNRAPAAAQALKPDLKNLANPRRKIGRGNGPIRPLVLPPRVGAKAMLPAPAVMKSLVVTGSHGVMCKVRWKKASVAVLAKAKWLKLQRQRNGMALPNRPRRWCEK